MHYMWRGRDEKESDGELLQRDPRYEENEEWKMSEWEEKRYQLNPFHYHLRMSMDCELIHMEEWKTICEFRMNK